MNAWNIGTILGIRIRIHWTFLILPIWIYFSSIVAGTGLTAATTTLFFVLAIFGCVVLHELGHALAARQFGIPTRDITLLPIGGLARLERMPRNPGQELWIAVAGPLVNVMIAGLLFLGLALSSVATSGLVGGFLWRLAIANVILVVFNMIPAFPMDGGRVLRSILAMFMDWVQATTVAVAVGKIAAVGFGLFGLLSGNLMLALIAVFIFFSANSELVYALASQSPSANAGSRQFAPTQFGQTNTDGMWAGRSADRNEGIWFDDDKDFSVPATLSANSVAAWLANRHADYCQVVEAGRVIGTITKSQLLAALSRGFGNVPVGRLIQANR